MGASGCPRDGAGDGPDTPPANSSWPDSGSAGNSRSPTAPCGVATAPPCGTARICGSCGRRSQTIGSKRNGYRRGRTPGRRGADLPAISPPGSRQPPGTGTAPGALHSPDRSRRFLLHPAVYPGDPCSRDRGRSRRPAQGTVPGRRRRSGRPVAVDASRLALAGQRPKPWLRQDGDRHGALGPSARTGFLNPEKQ